MEYFLMPGKSRVIPPDHIGTEYYQGSVFKQFYEPGSSEHLIMDLGHGGNYGYPRFPSNRNIGGPFQLRGVRVSYGISPSKTWWYRGTTSSNNQHYVGSFVANPSYGVTVSPPASAPNGQSYAAEAYSKMKPTKPIYNAATNIGELRELPRLLQNKINEFRSKGPDISYGDTYLNVQFGWIPLLRAVVDLVDAQRVAQTRLKQLLRDEGRPVRRRIYLSGYEKGADGSFSVPPIQFSPATYSKSYTAFWPILNTRYYAWEPNRWISTASQDLVWASARFRYWLPAGPRDIQWKKNLLRRLYGLSLTPTQAYNLIPWSWLVDWFGNLGDVITNLSAELDERLAADYFYVMREQHNLKRIKASCEMYTSSAGAKQLVVAESTVDWFTKTRIRGSPFDVGLSQDDLSPFQLSILGALGLSRLF
uniref:Uncharacterized protein n=1 Tax=Beihai levi-like virus 1 TaxID=1922394 RepID=A0A1L3KIC3_9VIRU|nr:hypothetical protein [Beihai levi-like virus 1]